MISHIKKPSFSRGLSCNLISGNNLADVGDRNSSEITGLKSLHILVAAYASFGVESLSLNSASTEECK